VRTALPRARAGPGGGALTARQRDWADSIGLRGLHDEWIAFPRHHLPEGSMDQLRPTELPESAPALPSTTHAPTP